MKTKTISLYEYSELSKEAKEKALAHYREHGFDSDGLRVYLDNQIEPLLEKHGIKPVSDIKGHDSKYAKLYFSLSHCQGDGVMFENTFEWKQYTVYIQQIGRYYHSNSAQIEIQETNNLGFHMDDEHVDVIAFDKIYQKICKELERDGYEYVEDMESEEHFIEECNANEWTFRENGTREDL